MWNFLVALKLWKWNKWGPYPFLKIFSVETESVLLRSAYFKSPSTEIKSRLFKYLKDVRFSKYFKLDIFAAEICGKYF